MYLQIPKVLGVILDNAIKYLGYLSKGWALFTSLKKSLDQSSTSEYRVLRKLTLQ